MLELRAASLVDTHAIAAAVAGLCRPGDLVMLSGEMGAGKTAFAQGFGSSLGVSEPITSPTYTLVHTYDLPIGSGNGARSLHHADVYRLDRTVEVADLALDELAEHDGIVLIEWGDVVDALFGDHLVVHLDWPASDESDAEELDAEEVDASEAGAGGTRLIEISAVGPTWAGRWQRLVDACAGLRC